MRGWAEDEAGLFFLQQGADAAKDQSYFLFGLGQEELSRLMFPLGSMDKDQVREKAKAMGISTWDKADSEDICFVPDGDYTKIVEKFAKPETLAGRGEVKRENGDVVGHHEGIHRYTIGQRRGLGLAAGERLYVTGLNSDTNEVYVGPRKALEALGLQARDCKWSTGITPSAPFQCTVRIRYGHRGIQGEVIALGDRAIVRFEAPQVSVAPGQAVVFYQDDLVIGGGWILEASTADSAAHVQ